MASEDVLNYVKAVGLFTAGIATGTNFCASYLAMPALLSPRSAPPRELQAQWNHLYDRGKFTLPPLSIIAGAAFSYVAYHDESLRTPYTVAAVSVVGIIPFTVVGMRANLRALLEKRAWVEVDRQRLRQLLHEWTVLNWVRVTMLGVGFGTALVKAIC